MAKQYLDLTGLQNVIGQIKTYYSESPEATPRVGWASNALSANQASTLVTPRAFSITGDVTAAAVEFNGSAPVVLSATIADVVASTSGAGGSHGLMTAAQAEKLAGVATGAQVNVLESVSVTVSSTTSTTIPSVGAVDANKNIEITLPQYALKTDVTASMRIKNVVDFYDDIATDDPNPEIGDVYIVRYKGTTGTDPLNAEYVYVAANKWEEFGNTVILENYATKTYVDQHKWTSGDITDFATAVAAVKVNAASAADKLTTARTIDFTGDITGTQISFDGSANVSTTLTIGAGKVTNAMLAGSIDQSKITNLTTDLAAKMPKIGSTDATAHVGEVAAIQSDGTVTYGGVKAADLITSSAVETLINNKVDSLDYAGSTVGYYVTQVTETNGVIEVTREAKGAAAAGSLDGVTALIDGDTVDTALTGDYYVTAIPTTALSGLFS